MKIRTIGWLVSASLVWAVSACRNTTQKNVSTQVLGAGLLPDVYLDSGQVIHLVYGVGDSILYASSADGGQHFTEPQLVDTLPGLMLIAKRGPQISGSADALVVLAVNKAGNIFYYRKEKQAGASWRQMGKVNDVPEVAREAFVDISSDGRHTFYATWLDLRGDHHNKIAGARSEDDGKSWLTNRILYASPGGVVCPCCKPSVAMHGRHVYVMFRNQLNGSRDLYVLRSDDGGRTFGDPRKLGLGTWKLDACPMDGGGLAINAKGEVFTAWMREGNVFISTLASPEQLLTKGDNCTLAVKGESLFVAWRGNDSIHCTAVRSRMSLTVGKGRDAVLTALDGRQVVCLWDDGSRLYASRLQWNEE